MFGASRTNDGGDDPGPGRTFLCGSDSNSVYESFFSVCAFLNCFRGASKDRFMQLDIDHGHDEFLRLFKFVCEDNDLVLIRPGALYTDLALKSLGIVVSTEITEFLLEGLRVWAKDHVGVPKFVVLGFHTIDTMFELRELGSEGIECREESWNSRMMGLYMFKQRSGE